MKRIIISILITSGLLTQLMGQNEAHDIVKGPVLWESRERGASVSRFLVCLKVHLNWKQVLAIPHIFFANLCFSRKLARIGPPLPPVRISTAHASSM